MDPQTKHRWVKEELVILPLQADDAHDAIRQLGAKLEAAGYVKASWVDAAIEREKVFATGLPTPQIGVAIPHADVEHVLRQGLAVGVLEEPVAFGEMGNPESTVEVTIICALAVNKSELMVKLLQQLVEIFQTPETLREIAHAPNAAEIVSIFERKLDVDGTAVIT
ncbi:MAG: PTS sugar transporter subunit IIA [Anaerolineae bacterium]